MMTVPCPCCENALPYKSEFLGRKLKCRFCESKFRLNHDGTTEVLVRSKISYLGATVSRSLTPKEVKELQEHQVETEDDFEPDLLTHEDDLNSVKFGLKSLMFMGVGLVSLVVVAVFYFLYEGPNVVKVMAVTELESGDRLAQPKASVADRSLVKVSDLSAWEPTSLAKVDMPQHEDYKSQVMKELLTQERRYQHQRNALKKH